VLSPRRFHRLRAVLERRQPDLTVVLENVHKPHNFSAVVRTADAVGVWEAHAVVPEGGLPMHHLAAGGSKRWVNVNVHSKLEHALAALPMDGYQLLAAHPSDNAIDFRELDFTVPSAVLFGQEKDGLSPEALQAASHLVRIPMEGMVASLNVSVAAALILFEAQRQRSAAGLYETSRLPPEIFEKTLFEWAYPEIARVCGERGAPYPELSRDGEILGVIPGTA
jgi:tRNA (guanosine-2'-O-)-methyltransferase